MGLTEVIDKLGKERVSIPEGIDLSGFKKLEGILYSMRIFSSDISKNSDKLILPKKITVISKMEDLGKIRDYLKGLGDKELLLRFDSITGEEAPHSSPKKANEIEGYIEEELRDGLESGKFIAILEEFENDSVLDQLKWQGAVDIDISDKIVISYVGPGFGSGKTNLGQDAHLQYVIEDVESAIYFDPCDMIPHIVYRIPGEEDKIKTRGGTDFTRITYENYLPRREERVKKLAKIRAGKKGRQKPNEKDYEKASKAVPKAQAIYAIYLDEFFFRNIRDGIFYPIIAEKGNGISMMDELGGKVIIQVIITDSGRFLIHDVIGGERRNRELTLAGARRRRDKASGKRDKARSKRAKAEPGEDNQK